MGAKNNLSSNQLTVVIVEKIPVEEEPEVSTIPEIPEDPVEKERDTIAVSMLFYSLKRRPVLTVRKIRQTWRMILMKRIWTM